MAAGKETCYWNSWDPFQLLFAIKQDTFLRLDTAPIFSNTHTTRDEWNSSLYDFGQLQFIPAHTRVWSYTSEKESREGNNNFLFVAKKPFRVQFISWVEKDLLCLCNIIRHISLQQPFLSSTRWGLAPATQRAESPSSEQVTERLRPWAGFGVGRGGRGHPFFLYFYRILAGLWAPDSGKFPGHWLSEFFGSALASADRVEQILGDNPWASPARPSRDLREERMTDIQQSHDCPPWIACNSPWSSGIFVSREIFVLRIWRNRKLKESDCRLVGTMKNF